mmetsp:Transcript_113061/g.225145  ORF Transcript_113061/g.225145 Transcript_113061/m.225145 type:complete len:449 (-) Transcript_113061:59-1405(-)
MGANCVASTSIGCLFCYRGCNAEKLRNAFTFIPPPPSYRIVPNPENPDKGRIAYLMDGLRASQLYRRAAESSEVWWVTTKRGTRVPLVWMKFGANKQGSTGAAPSASQPNLVLLHCHGNATDIGMMMGPYYELAKVLGIDVIGVEYSGYGAASGEPSSANTKADLEAAYDFVAGLGVPPKRIVAYGQSVGSGPVSCLTGSRELGGIVLHSPLLSGIKVIDPHPNKCCRPSCVWHCFDFYPNYKHMKSVTCPAFIMHGQRDDIIPFYHGYQLHRACPKASRWPAYFPSRAGHNNLVETDMQMYFGEVKAFLDSLLKMADGLGSQVGALMPSGKNVLLGAREVDASPRILAGGLGDVLMDAAPEPKAGPEDGRYEQLRAGHVLARGQRRQEDAEAEEFQDAAEEEEQEEEEEEEDEEQAAAEEMGELNGTYDQPCAKEASALANDSSGQR